MTFIKVTRGMSSLNSMDVFQSFSSALLFTCCIIICEGQFLTPDQLREQYELGFGARTHYEMSGGQRTDMFSRVNPDYLLQGLSLSLSCSFHCNMFFF